MSNKTYTPQNQNTFELKFTMRITIDQFSDYQRFNDEKVEELVKHTIPEEITQTLLNENELAPQIQQYPKLQCVDYVTFTAKFIDHELIKNSEATIANDNCATHLFVQRASAIV